MPRWPHLIRACRSGEAESDNFVGVLHAKDLLRALHRADGDTTKIDILDIAAPAWFVPDTTSLQDQLNAFLRHKSHFSLVVDEYGEVMGAGHARGYS